jgi:phosphoribosylformylglycinamidine cyclo-ligase
VLSDTGFFGSLFELKGYSQPVLVSSTDGVGTKLKIASALGKHDTVGIDLVNHCVNDIFTCGAEPLFFLDYIAMGKLVPEQVESIVKGMAAACREVNCALIGGETAEMPGMYSEEDYDLAGFIVGVVEKSQRLDQRQIRVGDVVLALPSSGLHTNGYSLVRKVFGGEPAALKTFYPELGRTLGEELLEPHRCYYRPIKPVLNLVKGLAHITGGGFEGNIPRVLPAGLAARFDKGSWPVPPIFSIIQRRGNVADSEMYRVFNMGVGMVVICSPEDVAELTKSIPEARQSGRIVEQQGNQRVIIA